MVLNNKFDVKHFPVQCQSEMPDIDPYWLVSLNLKFKNLLCFCVFTYFLCQNNVGKRNCAWTSSVASTLKLK